MDTKIVLYNSKEFSVEVFRKVFTELFWGKQQKQTHMTSRKIVIYRVSHGRHKGQYRFRIVADNHEVIASGEAYLNKGDLESMVKEYFPGFPLEEGKERRKIKK